MFEIGRACMVAEMLENAARKGCQAGINNGKVYDDVLKVWRDYGAEVSGGPIACGHYVPEEAPDETLGWFLMHFS